MKVFRYKSAVIFIFWVVAILPLFAILLPNLCFYFSQQQFFYLQNCIICLACLIATRCVILPCVFFIFKKINVATVAFDEQFVYIKKSKKYIANLKIRYFRFQWSFLELDLSIPKLVFSGEGEPFKCYITTADIKQLKRKFGYDIKEV